MIERDFAETVAIPAYRFAASWLIGATTFAIDRALPRVELIHEPAGTIRANELAISLARAPVIAPAITPSSRRRRLRARLRPLAPVDVGDAIFFDTRSNNYFNWSHQVNYFLTTALLMRARIDRPMLVVLPEGMSATAVALYRRFGFDTLLTDGAVTGRHFRWDYASEDAVFVRCPALIAPFMAEHGDDPALFSAFPDLPRKPFLSRRGNRAIVNEAEIEALLVARGYTKVYAEDLTADQQFALLRQATHLVAVHGAALAPLQYRSPTAPPLHFVEICPIGHMTRMFRFICEQTGGTHCAVRGRLKPDYVKHCHAAEPGGLMAFSGDDFEVDPRSLEVALEIEATGRITDYSWDGMPIGP